MLGWGRQHGLALSGGWQLSPVRGQVGWRLQARVLSQAVLAGVVAFETKEEWTKVYNLLQANMAKSGKTQMSFWLNAGYDQNTQKFRWLTNGKGK